MKEIKKIEEYDTRELILTQTLIEKELKKRNVSEAEQERIRTVIEMAEMILDAFGSIS